MGQRKFGKDEEKRIRAEIFSQGPEDAGIIPGIMTSGPETATPETMGPEETVTPEAMVAPETTAPETTTEDG
jgi:hypothetical protein